MDVYFKTSAPGTTAAAGGGAVVNSKHGDRSATATTAAVATRSFWKLARMMSKHDHRIAPSNAQQVNSLKKRAMQYFTAATTTKPALQQQHSKDDEFEQKGQVASSNHCTTAVPQPALLPAAKTTMKTTTSMPSSTTVSSSSATAAAKDAASTTVVGAKTSPSNHGSGHLKKSPSGQSASLSTASSYRLRKAMAWLGRSFHRFQYSGLIKFQKRKMENNASLPSLGDYAPLSTGRHAFEGSERPFTYA
ncbi:hypothetical protein BDB00DRAFT_814414 [Zychaea mexicana]|uniref:uncharacterized protein n=1 Tax=Zychaea mexicana TaxID=64656 RepID=UPI0022FEDBE2|nr:uncharacterized protein BDB00DRAFT_814414 [Zychaea mexicana]KAI9495373.1 hypothetical protein BDB00DRAFT_814414 [Zychaea mexicana]